MFKIGDRVRWSSQAAGITKIKEGQVVAVIPMGIPPKDTNFGKINEFYRLWGRTKSPNYKIMFDGWPRNQESYIVEVPGGKTDKATPKLYWPLVSKLEKV